MEDDKVTEEVKSSETPRSDVGFPEVTRHKKRSYGVFVLLGLVVIIAGFFVYSLFFGGESKDSFRAQSTPTPTEKKEEISPTDTPKIEDKKQIKVSVLNGSGVAGSANEVKKKVEALGFSDITTGNADSYDYTSTKVYVSPEISDLVKDELVAQLKKTYEVVEVETKKVDGYDIQIIIGPKVAKETATPTGTKSSLSPTRTPSPTPEI